MADDAQTGQIDQADVCIIGGGIVGLFCALEQAKAGRSVRLIDKLFAGSSRVNIGEVFLQGHAPDVMPFVQYADKLWKEAAREMGEDLGVEKRGSVSMALSDKQKGKLIREALNNEKVGFKDKFIEDRDALIKALDLNSLPETVLGGKISVADVVIDTGFALDRVKKEVIRQGVRIWGADEVTSFVKDDAGQVIGVKTDGGEECHAKHIIVCAGVWSKKILEKIGVNIPLRPARCHLLELSPTGKVPQHSLILRQKTGDIMMKSQKNGRVLLSYTGIMDPAQATWSTQVDGPLVHWVRSKAAQMLNSMAYARLQSVRAVSIAVTPDFNPFIGFMHPYENVLIAAGLNGKSYAYAPAIAKIFNAIVEEREPEVGLEAFSTTRDPKRRSEKDYAALAEDVAQKVGAASAAEAEPAPESAPEEAAPEAVATPEKEEEKEDWVDPFARMG